MAVTDGLGPWPVAQSAKRYSLNRQETEVQTVTSKDPVAGLKHHGSEGRIGPAARSPECPTGPIRPSLPWCLSPVRGSLDRSRAAQKPAARQRRPVLHCHGVLALRQGPWTPAWTAAVAGKVTV